VEVVLYVQASTSHSALPRTTFTILKVRVLSEQFSKNLYYNILFVSVLKYHVEYLVESSKILKICHIRHLVDEKVLVSTGFRTV